MTVWMTWLAALAYGAATAQIWRSSQTRNSERWLILLAVLLHASVIVHRVFNTGTITLGVNEALSLFTWQSAALLWMLCWREPLRSLGTLIYPLAALALLLAWMWPTPVNPVAITSWKARLHILLSLLSAGLLTLAAVQSIALAIQERLLHQHASAAWMRPLPPLLTMERLLFQLILIGFCLLSATLLSGLWFIEDWMKQHLAHKTILSITAWLIFGVLLWGRWRYGWRGKTAIRWALSGYATLILAYFGSKLILEQVLGRHWS